MNRALVVLAALLALGMPASASDMVIYHETGGTFLAGLPRPVEGVNAASFVVTPAENHTRLRFQLGFEPEGVSFDTFAAEGTLRFRLYIELADAETGEPLPEASFRMTRNGTVAYEAREPVRVTVWLQQGAAVSWTMRVSAMPDPIIVE